jgi:hypothetical protein
MLPESKGITSRALYVGSILMGRWQCFFQLQTPSSSTPASANCPWKHYIVLAKILNIRVMARSNLGSTTALLAQFPSDWCNSFSQLLELADGIKLEFPQSRPALTTEEILVAFFDLRARLASYLEDQLERDRGQFTRPQTPADLISMNRTSEAGEPEVQNVQFGSTIVHWAHNVIQTCSTGVQRLPNKQQHNTPTTPLALKACLSGTRKLAIAHALWSLSPPYIAMALPIAFAREETTTIVA